MYTVDVGRSFLKLYNEKTGANLSARAFFDPVLWEIFFNSDDDKHLMHVTNSDFFQNYKSRAEKMGIPLPVFRREIFHEKIKYILAGKILKAKDPEAQEYKYLKIPGDYALSGGIAPGFWAGSSESTTSGQVSNLYQTPDAEAIYCSWIGAALGIGFGGNYDFLIDNPLVLWHLYLGWKYYRLLIEDTKNLKGRQISVWNGLWLTYGKVGNPDPKASWQILQSKINNHIIGEPDSKRLERPDWPTQLFALSQAQALINESSLLANGFYFEKANNTLGMTPIILPEVRRLADMWDYLLGLNEHLYSREEKGAISKHLQPKYSLVNAVQTGGLGLRALAPKDVHLLFAQYTDKGSSVSKLEKKFEKNPNEFLTLQSWILAMVKTTLPNDKELLETAERFAITLDQYARDGESKKTTANEKKRLVSDLLDANYKTTFLQILSQIIDDQPAPDATWHEITRLVTLLPAEHFKLFLAALKCTYVFFRSGGKITSS